MNLRPSQANKGRGLELTVIASQGNLLTLDKMATQGRFGRDKEGKLFMKQIKSPPDFIGTVNGAGRLICFDAKECELVRGFPIRDWCKRRPLQREWILRHGEAGAISGLLVEAKFLRQFQWLDWRAIRWLAGLDVSTAPWGTSPTLPGWGVLYGWADLGFTSHAIQFARLPGVSHG